MKRLSPVVAVLVLLLPGSDAPAPEAHLAPHRAVYGLSLIKARSASNIADVSGRLVTEWKGNGCEGYVLTQRIYTVIEEMEGPQASTDIRLNSYEAADGTLYKFVLDNFQNNTRMAGFRGEAKRSHLQSEGEAYLAEPVAQKIILPPGTLFPSQLAVKLASRVREGTGGNFERPSFDSSDYRRILRVAAFVGNARKTQLLNADVKGAEVVKGLYSAPVALSYFDENRRDGLPEYEISFPLYENGVVGNMRIDYGEFILAAKLIYLEALPDGEC